jgi:hypothetical protein
MTDPRLTAIAADASSREWRVDWSDGQERTELLICPTLSDPTQQDLLGLGFGVMLGGKEIAVWVWEAWTGTLIEPWDEAPPGKFKRTYAPKEELPRFHKVTCLEDAFPVFNRAASRYMAFMRRASLEECPSYSLDSWSDLEIVVTGGEPPLNCGRRKPNFGKSCTFE